MSESIPAAGELTIAFARMSGLLLSEETLSSALRLVTSLARETLPAALGAGVTLLDRDGKRTTAAATDSIVEQVDALQYELEEGPCLTAWADRITVRIDDVRAEQRWPRWTSAAGKLGMRAVLSVGLVAAGDPLGAIKVYASRPGIFDAHDEHVLSLFAGQAATLVANMQAYDAARQLSDNLKDALRARDTIAMAKGILIGRDGADEGTALTSLAALAAQRHTTVRDVAAATVQAELRRRRPR